MILLLTVPGNMFLFVPIFIYVNHVIPEGLNASMKQILVIFKYCYTLQCCSALQKRASSILKKN